MNIKKLITSGCSFSDPGEPTWPLELEKFLKQSNPNLVSKHFGVSSQGNELIQKKVTKEILESIEQYHPSELLVCVMWSTVDRKSFLVDQYTAEKISRFWKEEKSDIFWAIQFSDLENKFEKPYSILNRVGTLNDGGGWYMVQGYKMESDIARIWTEDILNWEYGVHIALENIFLLQTLCKNYNIKNVHSFILSEIWNTINSQLTKNNKHLFNNINWSKFVSTEGESDYLKRQDNKFIYPNDFHPTPDGHKKWFDDILKPQIDIILNDNSFKKS